MSDEAPAAVHGEGGVRRYAPYTAAHALRRRWALRGVGAAGPGVYVENGVRLLRHPERITLGEKVMLKERVRLCPTNPEASISIGDWTTVGHHTFVFAMARVEIARDCLIAPFCYIVDNEHGIEAGTLIREQPMTARPIVIGPGAWLGTGVVVTGGVRIGEGAVIGARSVVTRDVPDGTVAMGVPARVVGARPS